MADDPAPTLADDEAKLGEYATALADGFAVIAISWLQGLVDRRAPGVGSMRPVVARLEPASQEISSQFRALLDLDISEQPKGPLEVLREAVRYPTAVLVEAGVEPVARDDFAVQKFPDDVYDLTPASFGDVDPSLHELGLTWGAAKAHVHLRRRREAEQSPAPSPKVVALSVDLMDRSKISAAYPEAQLVRSVAKLIEAAESADVILVDLGRVDDPATLSALDARVVAYGSHVNEGVLAQAEAAGAEALPRSVFFRRLESGSV